MGRAEAGLAMGSANHRLGWSWFGLSTISLAIHRVGRGLGWPRAVLAVDWYRHGLGWQLIGLCMVRSGHWLFLHCVRLAMGWAGHGLLRPWAELAIT